MSNIDSIQPNAVGLPPLETYREPNGGSPPDDYRYFGGLRMPGTNFLISLDGETYSVQDNWELVEDFSVNVHDAQVRSIKDRVSLISRDIVSMESSIRQYVRDRRVKHRELAAVANPTSVRAGSDIEGVIAWGISGDKVRFITEVIVASEIDGAEDDIVIGSLSVSFKLSECGAISVTNRNRVVIGYGDSASPHPHWTNGGICLGEYIMPFEEAVGAGLIIEAIEQLMLHFTSYNSSDAAGETASRWELEDDVRDKIMNEYECITHEELL